MKTYRKYFIAALITVLLFLTGGCGKSMEREKKDIEFTVCDETRMPEELLEIVNEKKEKVFKLTYVNNNYLYIAIGYGEHDRDNLNVVVDHLYKTDTAIYVKTSLLNANATDTDAQSASEPSLYPYIVMKCEKYDLPVVFDID